MYRKCAKTDAELFLKEFGETLPVPAKTPAPVITPSEPEQIALEILFHETSPAESVEPVTTIEDPPERTSEVIAAKPPGDTVKVSDSEKNATGQEKQAVLAEDNRMKPQSCLIPMCRNQNT